MAGIVHGQLGVRCDVGNIAVVEGDGVLEGLANHSRVVGQPLSLPTGYLDIVKLEKNRQIPGRRSAVNGPLIAVFVKHGNQAGMVQVGMGQNHGIDLV